MKKLVISGSSKLQERAAYWRGYFEGRGYDVIDTPAPITSENPAERAASYSEAYTAFYQNIDRADAFFLMNEDKDDIGGYVGPSSFAELSYAIIGNLNRGKRIDINILQMPSSEQPCFDEITHWLNQGWINIYDRPVGKKAVIAEKPSDEKLIEETTEFFSEDNSDDASLAEDSPAPRQKFFISPRSGEKTINILSCKKRCLNALSPARREYLATLSPEFPAWLLKYIAAPEFQRLTGVSMTNGLEYSGLYNFEYYNSVFAHSIGVALIVWRFTHDKKQTLAALFHDIASPAFKHCIDFMNGDSETQESLEDRTGQIIRNSRVITRQLKKDGILPSEVADYHLFPLADNAAPGLAADRLEYTLANGLFLYGAWDIDQVRRFSDDLTVLKNESGLDELGFRDLDIAREFTMKSLPMFEDYRSDNSRVIMQFYADILKSMEISGHLSLDDLYAMNEREIIDWILSCGDKVISAAFREFQRANSIYTGNGPKKGSYCTDVKPKMGRYIVPLVAADEESNGATTDQRLTDLSKSAARAVEKFLDAKPTKYVGFDFDFTPYSE